MVFYPYNNFANDTNQEVIFMKSIAVRIGAIMLVLLIATTMFIIPANAYTADSVLLSQKVDQYLEPGKVTNAPIYDIDKVSMTDLREAGNYALSKNGKVFFNFTTLKNDAVNACVIVNPFLVPRDSNGEYNFILLTESENITKAKTKFEKLWSKKVVALESAHTDLGMYAVICAKLDLEGMNTDNLIAYSYDVANNKYERIRNANCVVDSSGFLYLQTRQAGCIVITEG